eukprot:2187591-Alexandrium_andersonii.AAC.1
MLPDRPQVPPAPPLGRRPRREGAEEGPLASEGALGIHDSPVALLGAKQSEHDRPVRLPDLAGVLGEHVH